MSAWMVSSTHIDVLLTAGLAWHPLESRRPMRWLSRSLTPEEVEASHEAGEPWGPGAVAIFGELRRELTEESAGWVGAMLLARNRASVDHRYAESELEQPYEYRRLGGHVDPVVVLKAVDCFEYQASEDPLWADSEAKRFCSVLRGVAIAKLPGYADGPGWGVDDRRVFLGGDLATPGVALRSGR